jgi:hypothetical protein
LVFQCCPHHDPSIFEIPQDDLKVRLIAPKFSSPGQVCEGILELQWELICERADNLSFFLRYTHDGGVSWQPVNLGFDWEGCQVDLRRLPGGEACRLQLIASTVLQTATAETESFRVPRKRRQATIATSNTRSQHDCRLSLELIGTAHATCDFPAEHDLVWSSNLQGHLGRGSHLVVYDLVFGDHQITLTAPDGVGGETQAQTKIAWPADRGPATRTGLASR